MQNSPFSLLTVAVTIGSTHHAYPRRDGQAELAWVGGHILRWYTREPSPILVLTRLDIDQIPMRHQKAKSPANTVYWLGGIRPFDKDMFKSQNIKAHSSRINAQTTTN